MCGEEELETLFTEICVSELEALGVKCVNSRIGENMAHALKIAHQEASPRALVGEVRERLSSFVELIIRVILVDVTAVIVVLDIITLNEWFKRDVIAVRISILTLQTSRHDEINGVLVTRQSIKLQRKSLAKSLAAHVLG
ncbi:hypothetical protein HG530_013212 [Fusarium avenaceum]|nr:hypothetical protein HG530_013212 [Fusarium avenaceum]